MGKTVLVMVWDGLRPDFVRPDVTPNLWALAAGGVRCTRSCCEFPSVTRLNAASLATGCHAGTHGLVANELYAPEIDPSRVVSAGQKENLSRLDELSRGGLLSVPSVSEILAAAGLGMAVVSSGSTGSAFIQNHRLTGPVINPGGTYPQSISEAIVARFGPPPEEARPNSARNDWVVDILCDYVLPRLRPSLIHLWLSDPDHTQHKLGIGSPAALQSIRENDRRLERIVDRLEELAMGESTDLFVLSDHGFSTSLGKPDLERELIAAGLKSPAGSGDVVLGGQEVYAADSSRVEDIVRFLQGSEWVGGLFAGADVASRLGCHSRAAVWQTHPRSAAILYSGSWDSERNEFGIAGRSASGGAATHGTFSPYDMNNVMVVRGPDFRSGLVSNVPCGLIDVAPTALQVLGVGKPQHMEGRIIGEALRDGPDACEAKIAESVLPSPDGKSELRFYQVDGTSYVRGGWPA